ncbi:MvaI/BcnI family restriction endonuclease [Massilia sp. GCM10020059]|uniref:MvaI/BcnI family restriction endonuclease n=1 Tax=Massilia agrisoli TaxID=2892444 RepID=A0ABS8IPN8_9BURK|nr:MvaI/BcnI family restriction endonuclease [Massilia agrisoli]MCC6070567.1 MvaI/BcnI family restriction endonuclease [Massilia agrisoli]
MKAPPRSFDRLRKDAKQLASQSNVSLTQAHEEVARANGYPNWKAVVKFVDQARASAVVTPPISTQFAFDDFGMDPAYISRVERQEDIPLEAKLLVAENAAFFGAQGVEFSVFEPTRTGLEKSILDATQPIRTHFEIENLHFFKEQGQGLEHKVQKPAFFVEPHALVPSTVSLYRPMTKKGDPRMWFKGLGQFAVPTDQIGIVVLDDSLYLFNLSRTSLARASPATEIHKVIGRYVATKGSVALELLLKLHAIAKSSIRSVKHGDTAVGMAVEAALGIPPNSGKKPDYRGIELKAGRGNKTRSTIFAQVAIWPLSRLKSSAEILNAYGYERGTDFKLYCTVSSQKYNSQGLRLFVDEASDLVVERDRENNEVAVWTGELLRRRLAEKHAETFWIEATSSTRDGVEHFDLHTVTHTKTPLLSQLMPLIQSGVITLDHLIKRKGAAVTEKGPLFKMNKRDLPLLFPSPRRHVLNPKK